MIKTVKHRAYAKINLALDIKGRENGMHRLDSIVTNIGIFDTVSARARADGIISTEYLGLPEELTGDSTKKMAAIIQQAYGTPGVAFSIKKRIPVAAGLGGSSADAAAAAHCMRKLFGLPDIPATLLLKAGSDVPYMYAGGGKRIRGTGGIIESIELPKAYYAVIVCPGGVSTAEAYKLYDEIGGPSADIDKLLAAMRSGQTYTLSNSLQRAAEALNGNITAALKMLKEAGFDKFTLSGAGSGVAAMCADRTQLNTRCRSLKKILPNGYRLYKS